MKKHMNQSILFSTLLVTCFQLQSSQQENNGFLATVTSSVSKGVTAVYRSLMGKRDLDPSQQYLLCCAINTNNFNEVRRIGGEYNVDKYLHQASQDHNGFGTCSRESLPYSTPLEHALKKAHIGTFTVLSEYVTDPNVAIIPHVQAADNSSDSTNAQAHQTAQSPQPVQRSKPSHILNEAVKTGRHKHVKVLLGMKGINIEGAKEFGGETPISDATVREREYSMVVGNTTLTPENLKLFCHKRDKMRDCSQMLTQSGAFLYSARTRERLEENQGGLKPVNISDDQDFNVSDFYAQEKKLSVAGKQQQQEEQSREEMQRTLHATSQAIVLPTSDMAQLPDTSVSITSSFGTDSMQQRVDSIEKFRLKSDPNFATSGQHLLGNAAAAAAASSQHSLKN